MRTIACKNETLPGDPDASVLHYRLSGGAAAIPSGLGCVSVELMSVDEFEK